MGPPIHSTPSRRRRSRALRSPDSLWAEPLSVQLLSALCLLWDIRDQEVTRRCMLAVGTEIAPRPRTEPYSHDSCRPNILLHARLDGEKAMWPRPDKSMLSNLGR